MFCYILCLSLRSQKCLQIVKLLANRGSGFESLTEMKFPSFKQNKRRYDLNTAEQPSKSSLALFCEKENNFDLLGQVQVQGRQHEKTIPEEWWYWSQTRQLLDKRETHSITKRVYLNTLFGD